MKQLFCKIADLVNEATVESFFVDRLVAYLGYKDEDISLKENIAEYAVGKGSKKLLYKPDYVIKSSGIPTIVIDAKSPKEKITDWESQCSSYCLEINKEFDYNPVRYFILSNGLFTNLYAWDQRTPLLKLKFDDFVEGSKAFESLYSAISESSIRSQSESLIEELEQKPFPFKKIPLEDLANKFRKLHQEIWQSEKK